MAVFGPDDQPIGQGGWDVDEQGNLVPRGTAPGTRINSNPTATATPGSPGGPQLSTPQGGQLINTPDSSRGTPFRVAPSAVAPSPQQVGAPNTVTPSSRTGAPPPAIRNLPTAQELMPSSSQPVPGWAGALGTGGLWGLGSYLMGKTIEPQPTNQGEDAVLRRFQPAPNSTIGTQTGTQPVTQTQPLGQTSPITGPPLPPTMTPPPPPPGYPPLPPIRPMGAIPPLPIGARAPVQHAGSPNLGYGVPGAQLAPASDPINPLPGHYRASVGNARGATWVPGGMDNPAPQIFRGPTTTYGAPNYGKGPIGAQNYYQPGSAPVGPGDWTGTGPVAGPLAAFAGNNPQSTSSGGRGGGQFQMPASASAPARAPMIQPQGTHFGSTARRVFGNPAMWQYPNVQM